MFSGKVQIDMSLLHKVICGHFPELKGVSLVRHP
jgi:hypothetical protein